MSGEISGRSRRSGVTELGVPVRAAPLGRQVEQVPQGFKRVAVAGILPGLAGRVKEFGTPEVADGLVVAPETFIIGTVGGFAVVGRRGNTR